MVHIVKQLDILWSTWSYIVKLVDDIGGVEVSTQETRTLTVTIDAPFEAVTTDLADPARHLEWATEFFAGPGRQQEDGSVIAMVPMMGGDVRFRIVGDAEVGILDILLAPVGAPYGPPLPVRVIPNGDGADVLWTLARMPGADDETWEQGLESMSRELSALKDRLEDPSYAGTTAP